MKCPGDIEILWKPSIAIQVAKIPFSVDDIAISLMSPDNMPDLSGFSCGEESLDDFFHHEVMTCILHKYMAAYALHVKGELVGVFTLMNDALMIVGSDEKEDFIDDLQYEVDESDVEFFSRQTSYPAINIGHLGISTKWQGHDIGSIIITYVAETFDSYDRAGCQFLTVDALNNPRTLKFYVKNRFSFQTSRDQYKSTRRMYRIL